jgi:hypothetical protein
LCQGQGPQIINHIHTPAHLFIGRGEVATLPHHVFNIISRSAQKEVGGVDAAAVIAGVADYSIGGNGTVFE